jgi:hypothetical protein
LAVDTAQKRFSLVGLGSPVPRLLPIPQGSFAADDRALLIYLYAFGESAVETPSGGWHRRHFRGDYETEAQRRDRIKAERIQMGILPPDPAPEPGLQGQAAPLLEGESVRIPAEAGTTYSLGAHLLPEDLAGLEALAARAAELAVDEEIALWLRLAEQRRLYAEWLRDEDDAAVLLLAIATIH